MNQDKRQLNLALVTLGLNLDPHEYEDVYSMVVIQQIYRGLFKYRPDGQVIPDLVKSWEESKDRLEYTFYLRDAVFSDGTPITSKHVVGTLLRMLHKKAPIVSDLTYLKGFKISAGPAGIEDVGVKIEDKGSVKFYLNRPSSLFFKHLATPDLSILKVAPEKLRQKEVVHNVVSGVYKVKHASDDLIKIEKWRVGQLDSAKPPRLISFRKMNQREQFAAAISGKLDAVELVSLSKKERIALKDKSWYQATSNLSITRFMIINPTVINQQVRTWMIAKIDKESWNNEIGLTSHVTAHGLIPPMLGGHLMKGEAGEVKAPKELIDKVNLSIDFPRDDPYSAAIGKKLKEVWSSSKMKVNLNPLATKDYLRRMFQKLPGVVVGRKGLDYPDGMSILTYFRTGPNNSTYFYNSDQRVNALLSQAEKEFSQSERYKIYKKVQQIILAQGTVYPLYFGGSESGYWSPKTKKVPHHPLGLQFLPFEMIELD